MKSPSEKIKQAVGLYAPQAEGSTEAVSLLLADLMCWCAANDVNFQYASIKAEDKS